MPRPPPFPPLPPPLGVSTEGALSSCAWRRAVDASTPSARAEKRILKVAFMEKRELIGRFISGGAAKKQHSRQDAALHSWLRKFSEACDECPRAAASRPMIEVTALTKRYGNFTAVRD